MLTVFIIIAVIGSIGMVLHVILEVNAIEKQVAAQGDELRKFYEA